MSDNTVFDPNILNLNKIDRSISQSKKVVIPELYESNYYKMTTNNKVSYQIFLLFIRLVNNSFDDNAIFNDNDFLVSILNKNEIVKILKNRDLNLELRTEILKFFRMIYIDIPIDKRFIAKYRAEFCKIEFEEDYSKVDLKIFIFLQRLISISTGMNFSDIEFNILINELIHFQEIIENNSFNPINTDFLGYLENGIILPIKVYLNKIFAFIHTIEGRDFLKIYEMTYYILLVKKYVLNNLALFGIDASRPNKNIKSNIAFERLDEFSYDLDNDIEKMQDITFPAFDINTIFDIISKHFLNIIKEPESMSLIDQFTKSKNLTIEEESNLLFNQNKNLAMSNFEKKMLKLCIEYQMEKREFTDNSLMQNLSDVHIYYEVNYRNLLLRYLFYSINNRVDSEQILRKDAYSIILKLLQVDTVLVQKEIKALLKENESTINLKVLTDNFFKHFIGVIFSSYNPSVFNDNDEYYITCNIIKIFKYLCEEHNNYFQKIFLKKLEFLYEMETRYSARINFYDLMIMILNKILILSSWDQVKVDYEYSDYFFDLFCCLIELLIEIIQGTKTKNFSKILVDNFKYESKLTCDSSGLHMKKKTTTYQATVIAEDSKNKPIYQFLNNIRPILFNDYTNSELYCNIRNELANFLLAFLEEKNCPENIKLLIINSFNPQMVLKSILITLKKVYLKNNKVKNKLRKSYTKSRSSSFIVNSKLKKTKVDIKKKKEKINKVKFDENMYNYFVDLYFNNNDFPESSDFLLANNFFKYLKNINTKFDCPDVNKIFKIYKDVEINNLYQIYKSNKNNQANKSMEIDELIYDELFFETYFVVKFFERITRSIYIHLEDKVITRIIFTLHPKINYLSNQTKRNYLYEVNRESRYTKLYSLTENSEYFKDEILYNYERSIGNPIFRILNGTSFYTLAVISYSLILFVNVYILVYYDTDLKEYHVAPSNESCNASEGHHLLRYLSEATSALTTAAAAVITNTTEVISNVTLTTEASVNETDLITITSNLEPKTSDNITNNIIILSAIQLFFNLICLSIWIFTKLPLLFKTEIKKHINFTKHILNVDPKITHFKKFNLLINTILSRSEALLFIWNILFGCVLFASPENQFLYSVQLLGAVNLSATLRNITLSVTLRAKQLLSAAILWLIVHICYTAFAFFMFKEKFYFEELDENLCNSFLYCFLTHIIWGLERHGGVGDVLKRASYTNNNSYFYVKLIYSLFYFILCVVLLLNIVFGIIIDTFRELRIKYQETLYDSNNVCFICGAKRDDLEKDGVDFESHISDDHKMWNYVYYMILLRFSDIQDLNSINSYAIDLINNNVISWFPTYRSKHLEMQEQEDSKKDDGQVHPEPQRMETEEEAQKFRDIHNNIKISNTVRVDKTMKSIIDSKVGKRTTRFKKLTENNDLYGPSNTIINESKFEDQER
jgi:hypothetical protein